MSGFLVSMNVRARSMRSFQVFQCLCLTVTLVVVCVEVGKNLAYKEQESPLCDLGPPYTPPEHAIPENASRPVCPTTFVTQYFRIPSKHDPEEYRAWIRSLQGMCLIVFTDSPHWWHADDQVLVHADICHEGRALNQSACFWREQWHHDPEARLHRSYQLYLAWNLKPWFLKEAVRLNPFQSDWFFWIDAGYRRASPSSSSKGGLTYTAGNARDLVPAAMDANVMNFLLIQPFPAEEVNGGYHYTTGRDRIAGNLFGGHKRAIHAWVDLYYQVFQEYVDRRWFVGKDQNLLNTLCTEHHDACALIDPRVGAWESSWFTMWQCLLGQRECRTVRLADYY
jgi:hypothetical protein